MSIGFILIIIITLSLIVGPMTMLRPNPMQQRKEKLRSIARANGLHFSIRNMPQQPDEMEKPAPIPVYFFAPQQANIAPQWLLLRTNYMHDIHFLGAWAWQSDARPAATQLTLLQEYLPQLPASVKAISGGGQGFSIYWTEEGGEDVLAAIMALLTKLQASDNL